jgi:hypothetical protein
MPLKNFNIQRCDLFQAAKYPKIPWAARSVQLEDSRPTKIVPTIQLYIDR